jgi:hypothetical protein
MHWAVSYLREDLQDIRNELRGLHARVDDARTEIRGVSERLDIAVTAIRDELISRIDDANAATGDEFRSIHKRIDDTSTTTNARFDSYFRWTMTAMVGMTGLLAALMKL